MSSRNPMMHRRLVAAAICLGASWLFYTRWILPVQTGERNAQIKITELRGRIDVANKELEAIQALKIRAALGVTELERLRGEVHQGAVMAWFPVLIRQAFAQAEIRVSSVLLNTTLLAPGLPGCERSYWHILAPCESARRGFAGLLLAVNEIERQEPFVRLLDFSVKSDPSDVNAGVAEMNFVVLAEQIRAGVEPAAR